MVKNCSEIIEMIADEMRGAVGGLINFGIGTGSFRPYDGLLRARGLYEALELPEHTRLHEKYPITYRVVSGQTLYIQYIEELAKELGVRMIK